MNQIKSFALVAMIASATALGGCGNKEAKSLSKMFAGSGLTKGLTSSTGIQAQIRAMKQQARQKAKEQAAQALAAQYRLFTTDSACSGMETSQEGLGGTCSCGDSAQTGGTFGFKLSCTSTEAMTFTCGSDTYKASSTTMSLDLSVSMPTETQLKNSMIMDFSATVTGGDFSSTAVACKFKLTLEYDLTKLQTEADYANSVEPAMDCGTDYSCTVGGETLSCSDLESDMEDTGQCS